MFVFEQVSSYFLSLCYARLKAITACYLEAQECFMSRERIFVFER